jgi:hypothetical protein
MPSYLYTYACHLDERPLCHLEFRSLFGFDSKPREQAFITDKEIGPSRSPFIKERIAILYRADHLNGLAEQVRHLTLPAPTFKIKFVKAGEGLTYDEQRSSDTRRTSKSEVLGTPGCRKGCRYAIISGQL